MFFLGMEIDMPDNRSMLFIPLVAQGLSVLLTLGLVTAACFAAAGWTWLTGVAVFILLIFNSTAVVSEFCYVG